MALAMAPVCGQDMAWVQEAMERAQDHGGEAKKIIASMAQGASSYRGCRAAPVSLAQQTPKRHPDLLVFVSFSMPMDSLKRLNQQVMDHGGKLVFRGLHEGSFMKMAQKLKALSAEVLIDPTLFEAHGISEVPVFVKGNDKLTGHVTLDYALDQFKKAP